VNFVAVPEAGAALDDHGRNAVGLFLLAAFSAGMAGLDFDPVDGGSWVRVSFAGATEEVAEAARRLANWLAG